MSLKSKSVLVTGGAGFIGSHLVDRVLREDPSDLVIVDNFFLGNSDNLADALAVKPDLEIIRVDASDLAAMQDIVQAHDVDVVFDLAVIPLPTSLTYPDWTVRVNIGIATTFCEIVRRGAVEKLVHFSSSEAYGTAKYVPMDEGHPLDAITPYAASKSGADQVVQSYVRTFGIDAISIRPFNNFGPRQNPGSYAGIIPIVVKRVLLGEPIQIHGDGEQTRDFIYAPDTASTVIDVYGSNLPSGSVVNVATGVETSVNTLVRRMLEIMGVPDHPVVHSAPRPGDVRRHVADVSRLVDAVGHRPPALSDESLRATIDWYRSIL